MPGNGTKFALPVEHAGSSLSRTGPTGTHNSRRLDGAPDHLIITLSRCCRRSRSLTGKFRVRLLLQRTGERHRTRNVTRDADASSGSAPSSPRPSRSRSTTTPTHVDVRAAQHRRRGLSRRAPRSRCTVANNSGNSGHAVPRLAMPRRATTRASSSTATTVINVDSVQTWTAPRTTAARRRARSIRAQTCSCARRSAIRSAASTSAARASASSIRPNVTLVTNAAMTAQGAPASCDSHHRCDLYLSSISTPCPRRRRWAAGPFA